MKNILILLITFLLIPLSVVSANTKDESADTPSFPFAPGTFDANGRLKQWSWDAVRTHRDNAVGKIAGLKEIKDKDRAADKNLLGYCSPGVETRTFKTDLDLTDASGLVQLALQVDDVAVLKVTEELTGSEPEDYKAYEETFNVNGTALWRKNRSYREFSNLIPTGRKYKLHLTYTNTANLTPNYGGEIDFDGVNVFVVSLATPFEIDAYIYGQEERKIANCVQRTKNSNGDDDLRVITGGHVKFKANVKNLDKSFQYKWSIDGGEADANNTNHEINWNAPISESEVTLTLTVQNGAGVELINADVKIKPIQPRVVRVKFIDDGTNKIVTLKDSGKNAIITAPQYDRIDEQDWETDAGHEAGQGDHKNDEMEVFKNESIAYVKGGKMTIVADLAATDLKNVVNGKPHTSSQHKDLSAKTLLKMSVVDTAPNLTFKNNSSQKAIGDSFEVQDWSALDYSVKTTFKSDQALGEGEKIQFYYESHLNWTIKVKDKDGNWVNSLGGETTSDTVHRSLCVPDKAPVRPAFAPNEILAEKMNTVDDNEAWEKVMQYSCDWTKGKSGGNVATNLDLVDTLWVGINVKDTSTKGAKHNINYTFKNKCGNSFGLNIFLQHGLQGSCGHMARFFSSVAAAQGLKVDVALVILMPERVKSGLRADDAYLFATTAKDVDGDWCEYVGGPAAVNNLWYYAQDGTQTGDHAFNTYGGNVYDPTFGVRKVKSSWEDYVSNALSHYAFRTPAKKFLWLTKDKVIGVKRVRIVRYKNNSQPIGRLWPKFP